METLARRENIVVNRRVAIDIRRHGVIGGSTMIMVTRHANATPRSMVGRLACVWSLDFQQELPRSNMYLFLRARFSGIAGAKNNSIQISNLKSQSAVRLSISIIAHRTTTTAAHHHGRIVSPSDDDCPRSTRRRHPRRFFIDT